MAGKDGTFPVQSGTAESPADFGSGPAAVVKRYLTEIKIYDRATKDWSDKVRKILNRYRNRANVDGSDGIETYAKNNYSLLWSAMQTMTPALFAHVPTPMVERRWKDNEDFIASTCAEVLDRALTYTMEQDDFEPAVKGAVFDYQIAGRGVVWLRKEVDRGEALEGQTNGDDGEEPADPVHEILDERISVDEVAYCDFGHTLARNWKEVSLVWRKLYMTRDALVKRFGSIGNKVELDYTPNTIDKEQTSTIPPHLYKLATVYELWDKSTKQATWIALGYTDEPLDQQDDPLHLKGFFPCPRPMFSSLDTTSLIPLPDYVMWEDQAREVDTLTARLHNLIAAARVRGGYDASFPEIARIFEEGLETDFIPFEKWSEFAQKGGIKGAIDFVPLTETIEAITELFQAREQAKRDAAEINGVGDILRGQNAGPEKTATESRISGQFGTLRLQDRQKEVQRFCRDIVRMMGELIAEGFVPETLEAMTGLILPTAMQKQVAQSLVQQDQEYQTWMATQGRASPSAAAPGTAQTASSSMSIGTSNAGAGAPGMTPPSPSASPASPIGSPAPGQPPAPIPTQMSAPVPVPSPPLPQPAPPGILFQAGELAKKPTWDDVLTRLHDDRLRSFTIDIETDSTIVADEDAEKQSVTEFTAMIGEFITQMEPIITTTPEFMPLAVEMMKFAARRFNAGRSMENVIEETGDRLLAKAAQPQTPKPDPKVMAAQAMVQVATTKANAEISIMHDRTQAEIAQDQQESQSNMALRQAQASADYQLEQAKAATDAQIAMAKANAPHIGMPG